MLTAALALFRILILVVSLVLQVMLKLRLGIPLIYTVLMITVFSGWAEANNNLAVGILIALLVMVGLSWAVSFVKRVREG